MINTDNYNVKRINLQPLNITASSSDVIAVIGVKDTDISKVFERFNAYDPLNQLKLKKSRANSNTPVIQCIKSETDLFKDYTAYDNFLLTEKKLLHYNKKQLAEYCDTLTTTYRCSIDLNEKIGNMTVSERIIVEMFRAFILDPDMLVLYNLFSFLDFNNSNILISMINDLKEKNKIILYLTTKWEDAIKIAQRVFVVMDDNVLGEMSAEEVKRNPQHLVYLLSGRKLIEEQDSYDETADILSLLNTGAEYLTSNLKIKDTLE
ncbi:MAG: hypothetical protein ACM3XR_07535 [Bacillota bacterium]